MKGDNMPWQAKVALASFVFFLMGCALAGSYVFNDASNRSMLIGAIIASFAGTVSYYFGSSDSSQKKDATIASQSASLAASTPGTPTPPMTMMPVPEPIPAGEEVTKDELMHPTRPE